MLRDKLAQQEAVARAREHSDRADEIGHQKSFGSHIRSYVQTPYTLVKDHRTGHKCNDLDRILAGDQALDGFLEASIRADD